MTTKALNPKHLHPSWPPSGIQNCWQLPSLKCTFLLPQELYKLLVFSLLTWLLLCCLISLFSVSLKVKVPQGPVLGFSSHHLFTLPLGKFAHDFNYHLCDHPTFIYLVWIAVLNSRPICQTVYYMSYKSLCINLFKTEITFSNLLTTSSSSPNLHGPYLRKWQTFL